MTLQIHLLGKPHLLLNQQPFKFSAPPKTLPLLAYLLLNREQILPRQQIAFTLWPDETEEEARTNLRRHLHHLQRALPSTEQPWLLLDAAHAGWNPASDFWLDVSAFERGTADEGSLAEAVALYNGDLLEGLYDDWLFFDRERLRERYFTALNRLLALARSRRDYSTALQWAGLMLARDPFREDAVRQAIGLRYALGDRTAALAEYERFRELLGQEMGVEPMIETQAVYQSVLNNERLPGTIEERPSQATAPAPCNTPGLPFLGREKEMHYLNQLWERAARGNGALLLLSGEAGVGKTRLLRELALQVESQGGRVLAGCCAPNTNTPYQPLIEALTPMLPLLTENIARPTNQAAMQPTNQAAMQPTNQAAMQPTNQAAMQPTNQAAMQPTNQAAMRLAALSLLLPELRQRCPLPTLPQLEAEQERLRLFDSCAGSLQMLAQPRPLLLVIEDAHWANTSTLQLLEFLVRSLTHHPILLIITYRDEETHTSHPLANLRRRLKKEKLATSFALHRLQPNSIPQLMQQLNLPAAQAEQLYHTAEGNPLFLTLLLHNKCDLTEPLPQTLQQAITQRMARLSRTGRAYAEVAAIFGAAFDPEAVRLVGGWDEAQAADALDEMLDQQVAHDTETCFEFAFSHHLFQANLYQHTPKAKRKLRHQRAAETLTILYPERSDELMPALAFHYDQSGDVRHAAPCYLRAAELAQSKFATEETLSALQRGLEQIQNSAPDTRLALRSVETAMRFLREQVLARLGKHEEQWQELCQLEALLHDEPESQASWQLLLRQSSHWRLRGHCERGQAYLERCQTLAKTDPHRQIPTLIEKGDYLEVASNYQEAIAAYQQALTLSQQANDLPHQQTAMLEIASVHIYLRDVEQIDFWIEQVRQLPQETMPIWQTMRLLYMATVNARNHYALTTALQYGNEYLKLAEQANDLGNQGNAHRLLGQVYSRMFDIRSARTHYEAALHTFERIQKPVAQSSALGGFAALALDLGQYQTARQYYQAALTIGEQTDSPDLICRECINLGYTLSFLKRYAEEKQLSLRAIALAETLQNRYLLAFALNNLGEAERELGELHAALQHLRQSWQNFCEANRAQDGTGTLVDLGLTLLRMEDWNAARQMATEMEQYLDDDAEIRSDGQRLFWATARIWHALGETEQARALVERAHQIVQRKLAAIPDDDSRRTFLDIPYNRQIQAFYQQNEWGD